MGTRRPRDTRACTYAAHTSPVGADNSPAIYRWERNGHVGKSRIHDKTAEVKMFIASFWLLSFPFPEGKAGVQGQSPWRGLGQSPKVLSCRTTQEQPFHVSIRPRARRHGANDVAFERRPN